MKYSVKIMLVLMLMSGMVSEATAQEKSEAKKETKVDKSKNDNVAESSNDSSKSNKDRVDVSEKKKTLDQGRKELQDALEYLGKAKKEKSLSEDVILRKEQSLYRISKFLDKLEVNMNKGIKKPKNMNSTEKM